MTSFADTRVDICLYFIAPHALLPADIATIKRLGSMVPIVPIIAKVPLSIHLAARCNWLRCGRCQQSAPSLVLCFLLTDGMRHQP